MFNRYRSVKYIESGQNNKFEVFENVLILKIPLLPVNYINICLHFSLRATKVEITIKIMILFSDKI